MTIVGEILRAGGMAKYVEPDYASMPRSILEHRIQHARRDGFLWQGAEDPPHIRKMVEELYRKMRQDTLDHNWRILEREGFGM